MNKIQNNKKWRNSVEGDVALDTLPCTDNTITTDHEQLITDSVSISPNV